MHKAEQERPADMQVRPQSGANQIRPEGEGQWQAVDARLLVPEVCWAMHCYSWRA